MISSIACACGLTVNSLDNIPSCHDADSINEILQDCFLHTFWCPLRLVAWDAIYGSNSSWRANEAKQPPRLCDECEFGSGDGDTGFCKKVSVTYVSEATIRLTLVRKNCQNYLVGLHLPYRRLVDWLVEALRDFKGRYRDELGNPVGIPGIGCVLTPGAEWWMRDVIENGKWRTVDDVPALRREAVGRWRLVATVIQIMETLPPNCSA